MKLSTRSRYGTRMMVDLARHYNRGAVHMCDIARRQNISMKYLRQLVIPLKKAGVITSVRGPGGGYLLSRPPETITAGDLVRVLEHDISLVRCLNNPEVCDRVAICPTRHLWKMAAQALFDQLDAVTLAALIRRG